MAGLLGRDVTAARGQQAGAKGSSRQCQFAALGPVHRSGTHVTYSSRNLKSFSAIAYRQRGANEDSAVSHPPWERSPDALISASVKGVEGVDWAVFPRIFAVGSPFSGRSYA
ncbi:hypothetical protein NicSoilC5_35400 [Arthrobacter sp. NicSoilC5]|nr:hypothetical protein NicSoilC5_35400 [Arthrobacter sp. NicSoilC5]